MKLPIVSGMKVLKMLVKNGFEIKGRGGSHVTLEKRKNYKVFRVTIALHKELTRGLLKDIIRQSGYSREEFLELL